MQVLGGYYYVGQMHLEMASTQLVPEHGLALKQEHNEKVGYLLYHIMQLQLLLPLLSKPMMLPSFLPPSITKPMMMFLDLNVDGSHVQIHSSFTSIGRFGHYYALGCVQQCQIQMSSITIVLISIFCYVYIMLDPCYIPFCLRTIDIVSLEISF